jgi:glycosyltransferase involved in cell wall biosynthesis/GT2 family glycosyltransferase
MPTPELVSAVIPAYNPPSFVEETIASIQKQTHPNKEIILVDDGSDKPESQRLIAQIEGRGIPNLRVVHQQNRGLAGARNTGFRHARGEYVVPIDADDRLEPEMMETCLAELKPHPEAGFCYFDYHVFGDTNYIERPGEYSLYRLLEENFMACCILVSRRVWEAIGGYDEWHRWGYEDWSFFLNLGKNGYFGRYIERPLFGYRTHGRGLHYIGLERHASNWAHMTEKHPEVLLPEGRLRVKREWAPSICFVVQGGRAPSFENQTVRDYQTLANVDERTALERSRAPAFLWLSGDRPLEPQAAEECIWALTEADWVTWKDTGDAPPPSLKDCAGPLGVSRRVMQQPEPKPSGIVRRLPWRCREAARPAGREDRQPIVAATARAGASDRTRAKTHALEARPAAAIGGAGAVTAGTGAAGTGAARQQRATLSNGPQRRERQDGPIAAPGRSAASSAAELVVPSQNSEAAPLALGRRADRLYHHLQNAELLSREAWLKHPLRSSARLIPLRWKERVNQVAGKPVFDLSFYLKFQPRSVLLAGTLIERLDYIPPLRQTRRRLGLFTPHLGVGGAENVLLEFASQIDRSKYEVLLLAAQSNDSRLLPEWRDRADWVYDLARLIPVEKAPRFLYSVAANWELDVLMVQNSAAAYSILPALKQKRPSLRVVDILHAVDEDWDFFAATLEVAEHLDRRMVISEAGRKRLENMDTPAEKIRLIRNGVDLDYFDPARFERGRLRRQLRLKPSTAIVLFAGRLDPVKRPLLLPEVARELRRIAHLPHSRGRRKGAAHFVVAGDGPDGARLRSVIQTHRLEKDFTLLGHVADIAGLLAEADLLLIPSQGEGIPLVLLEALAMHVPVVACRAGAIEEALPADCGVLVEPGAYEETRLAEALHELLNDPERRAAMGSRGRAFVEKNHSLDETRSRYRALLDEIEQLFSP